MRVRRGLAHAIVLGSAVLGVVLGSTVWGVISGG
jgi:hypothetical protein